MRLVVDTNVLFAAALRDALTRRLVLQGQHRLYVPPATLEEMDRHWPELVERAGTPEDLGRAVVRRLLARLTLVPAEALRATLPAARAAVADIDPDDAPFVAAALAVGCDLWSNDKPLRRQRVVRVWSTGELAALQEAPDAEKRASGGN